MKSITALTGISDESALTLKFRSSVSSTTSLNIFLGSPAKRKNKIKYNSCTFTY